MEKLDDTISRQEAINLITDAEDIMTFTAIGILRSRIRKLPSAQPFHDTTMTDVLKYIDGMPEDVWQEFTACLECRGWELKWCGG